MKDNSFSVDVITRILSILSEEGNMKRTVLAGKARLNYSALVRYLKLLKTLRWIDSTESDTLIQITNIGREFNKLLEDTDDHPSELSEDALERLMEYSREKSDPETGKVEPLFVKSKESTTNNTSCMFCGNTIKSHGVVREVGGEKYSFDKRDCALLFMRFRDVYGKEFTT